DGGIMNNRKRHVANVALRLFVEKGIQQTSIQEIIEQANISKGTFYNYFSSKNDCIAEILEALRYDASQIRMEMQIGKDEEDRQILIEQISILIQLNEEYNLNALFEAILSSNEKDLKKLVMHHRIYEMEWLAKRFTEVFGQHIEEYSFECTILFYGMMQHIMFTMRVTNMPRSIHKIVDVILSYMELIISKMIEQNSKLIDQSAIHLLRANVDRRIITVEELMELAKHIEKEATFTQEQQDLFTVIISELKQDRIRTSVLQPLLKPFQLTFMKTPLEAQVNTFTNMVWYFLKVL
ncbi:MAG TPA: TetR/AcrR family transcriptional regulator, partial [Ureibacillus sp.]|nr:TetR/AcrR family transcriptional regulator [Ureibacillus sp.]